MNFEEFENVFDEIQRAKPLWFQGTMEPLATDEQISIVELKLGVKLPDQYLDFLKKVGSGYFGFTNIFSVNPDGEWYLLDKMSHFEFSEDFIPITDDETGGYFGFIVSHNKCKNEVYYIHPDDGVAPVLKYGMFLDYVVQEGFKK